MESALTLTGSAAISFSEKSILGIVSAMFGENMTEIDEEITDAVGEISNMVASHVTTKLAEMD
jgi:chemotaxis protein CheX